MIGATMDRYVGRAVLLAILLALVCFLTLVTLFALVEELQDGAVGYGAEEAVLTVLYTTPRRIYEFVPYAVFIGALAGLGVLSSRSELTVFRAAGVSLPRAFGAAALPVALLLAANQVVGEFVAGPGEAAAATVRFEAIRSAGDASPLAGIGTRRWYREGPLFTTIDGYGGDDRLIGVRQFLIDDDRNLVFSRHARRATYAVGEGEPHWLLHDVRETRFDLDPEAAVVRTHDSLPWPTSAGPELLSARSLLEPARLSLADLRRQVDYLEREGLNSAPYAVSLWSKALQPAAVLGLVWLALGFVAGPLREVSLGARLCVGIVGGLAYNYLQELFSPMALVFGLPPLLAVAAPIAVCWLVGWVLVRRAS